MQVSGSTLPVLSGYLDYSTGQQNLDRRPPGFTPERNPDADQQNRQQTVEYVFRGEFEDTAGYENTFRNAYAQSIDPANAGAISAYNDVNASAAETRQLERQGSLVNLYV